MSSPTFISSWFKRRIEADEPVPAESAPPSERLNLTPLRQQINQAFNLEELRTLCFDLGVDFDDLAGETKSAKVVSLIDHMQRRKRLPDLLEALAAARPHVEWYQPDVFTTQELRLRDKVLRNVQAAWIEDYLKKSLRNEIVLELDLVEKPEALMRNTGIVLRQAGLADRSLPEDTTVRDVFEVYVRSLLILGEPGSGKTISMLQLAEGLIEEAREQPGRPIPVVLNLSSWAERRHSLTDWLVEEMLVQYQVARRISRPWVESSQLLYLLDGLDEVDGNYRDDCVIAINAFLGQYPADIVVCSRIADYEQLNERLNLSTAVCLQPLTGDEIQRYLGQEGLALQAVREMLSTDSDLHQLAQSPLMLNIMTLAYQGLVLEELKPLETVEARRHHLFFHYIECAFERRPLSEACRYNKEEALEWLTKLAQGMRQTSQSIFHIERLQPTWLPAGKYRRYKSLVGLIGGLLVGLIAGLIVGLIGWLSVGLSVGLIGVLIGGLVGVLGGGLGNWLSATLSNRWIRFTVDVVSVMLIFVLIFGLIDVLIGVLFDVLSFGLMGGVSVGLSIGIIAYQSEIMSIEALSLSWPSRRKLRKGIWQGFIFGLIGGLIYMLFGWLIFVLIDGLIDGRIEGLNEGLIVSLIYLLILGPIFGLIGGLIGGLMSTVQTRPAELVLRPNQGIRSSFKNGIRMCLLFSVLAGLLGLLLDWLTDSDGVFLLMFLGIALPASFLYFGGVAVLHHIVLRFFLSRYDILPLHLISFCDDMSERILLRRVGGGWVFIHRYLLEHFAEGYEIQGQ